MSKIGQAVRPVVYAGTGAAIAYWFDPDRGRGRRTKARDQLAGCVRRAQREVNRRSRYLTSTARGSVERVIRSGGEPADDRALVDRVKSEVLGRPDLGHHEVVVDAVNGVVTLRGQMADPQAVVRLVRAVSTLPGVVEVHSLIHPPGEVAPNKAEAVRAADQAPGAATG
jgi:hypothetical protein